MKIKTFINKDPAIVDRDVNAFEEHNDVKATQTDMVVLDGVIYHKAVVFFKSD